MSRTVRLPTGEVVSALGQGTWYMGERGELRGAEVKALRAGLDLGISLIDTAEMYGEGRAEEVVGEAIAGRRDGVFLVSKVYPHNASRDGVVAACGRSLKRLRTDRIDLYLLHWRGEHPLVETLAGFEALQRAGKIRHWGVSNFDVADMEELKAAGGGACAANQILYNASRRGPEFDLMPYLSAAGIPVMAYSPIEQGRLPRGGALGRVARKHGVDPFQVALAWVMRSPDVIAIPKATHIAHVEANARALALVLDAEDLAEIDREFPPPAGKAELEMI
ncbi:aldo/keto reductase [Xanthobacter agilis]|uniref:Diketogulonate reductase-like aldo/keto reductase n=1 Tax=Xanthobacter agilis TaxID=47492 RepID=A0ABU0LBB0_XANAG|nr:aldo/keto reductase [Xanthobacter agilis]MDQ0504432.1 diketogulonate reductase-like aldo/keto reductase [Xanthobacter agilis]